MTGSFNQLPTDGAPIIAYRRSGVRVRLLGGGGGSILTVPILTYVLGMEPLLATTASLFVVGVTALVSMARHARDGRVAWRTGFVFGLAGMTGALVGGQVGGLILARC